jgi:hypothetical protein
MKPTWCTLPHQVLSNVTKSVRQEVMFGRSKSDRKTKQTNHLLSSTIIPSNHGRKTKQTNHLLSSTIIPSNHGGAHSIELSHLHLINSCHILAMFTKHHLEFRGF